MIVEQPPGHHLAELNWGRLRYGWDDPRIAPFQTALDRVFAVAERQPGFVWRLDDDAMEAEQLAAEGAFGADPFIASTLSVWRDGPSFIAFTWRTVHARLMDRAGEWFRDGESGLILWWLPAGQRPTVAEGLARHQQMCRAGPGPDGFGWAGLGLKTGENPRHARG